MFVRIQRLREDAINQENCNMLDRLAKVMQRKTIDNEGGLHLRERKTLASTTRKHQLQRITQENQRLLQRIQQVNPIIDHLEFEIRAKKDEYMKRKLSDFREVPLPPQIETWLLQKNKQLHAPNRDPEGEEGVCTSTSRDRDKVRGGGGGGGGGREVYRGVTATTSAKMRRSQSARTYQEDILEGGEEEEEEEGIERRKTTTTTTRRRKVSKKKGRKTAAANDNNKMVGSPMRGKIRPKSGRI